MEEEFEKLKQQLNVNCQCENGQKLKLQEIQSIVADESLEFAEAILIELNEFAYEKSMMYELAKASEADVR